jgi:translation initiation factor IF-1
MKLISYLIICYVLLVPGFVFAEYTEPAIINTVTDSLGNVQTNSIAPEGNGNWPSSVAIPVLVKEGDKITFTVNATDPENGTLQYKFQTPDGTATEWSISKTWTWTVNAASYGKDKMVWIFVRDSDGYEYLGSGLGDDYTYAIYDVTSLNATGPAIINTVTDSLGNIQTNSFAPEGNGNWPSSVAIPVQVKVGDKITFTVNATDPENGTLQYKFQTPDGVVTEWSTSNSWTWNVNAASYGKDKMLMIFIRDSDGYEYLGSGLGDDGTYAIYDVISLNATGPAIINTVTDSLGNIQTNSFAPEGNGNWPSSVAIPVQVKVGDKITFTVNATDPENGTLQYKFQTPDGVVTEWSTSNSWTWNVDAANYGKDKMLMIFVRDSDGYEYLGSGLGDDGTYAIYDVMPPVLSFLNILL